MRDQLVLGEAEEREVAVVHPREQRGGLLALVAVDRRRRLTQLGDQVGGVAAHRRPVRRRRPTTWRRTSSSRSRRRSSSAGALTRSISTRMNDSASVSSSSGASAGRTRRELAARVPPDADHGVDEQVDPRVLAAQLHRGRVDQERHVVGHELDDRVRGLPAVLLEVGVVDAHARRAGRALAGEAPVGERGAVEVERLELGEVLRWHAAVVLADELLRLRRLVLAEPLPDACADGLDQRAVELLQPGHGATGASSVVSSGTSRSTNPSGAGPGGAAGSRSYTYGAR